MYVVVALVSSIIMIPSVILARIFDQKPFGRILNTLLYDDNNGCIDRK